jgi:c-di-GMP-binding flagellar brake protein YcgR
MKKKSERRSKYRIAKKLPARVRANPSAPEFSATTRDLSEGGIFLYTAAEVEPGSEVELVLVLPEELTGGEKCWVCCQATVVRVEPKGAQFGVAARIKRMDVLPEIGL